METTVPPAEFLPPQEELRVAVVVNPVSAHSEHVREQLLALMQSGCLPAGSIYQTVPGGLETNAPGLHRLLIKGAGKNQDGTTRRFDGLVILSGDGVAEDVANFLAGHPDLPDDIRDTVIIQERNGGASDGHRARFKRGDLNLRKLGGLPIAKLYPVRVETTSPTGQTTTVHRAPLYDTKGFTAQTAEELNKGWRRNSWLKRFPGGKQLSQYLAGAWALLKSSDITLVEDGQKRAVRDRVISNNSRMGGFGFFPGDGRKDTFFVLDVEGGSRAKVFKTLLNLALKRAVWRECKEIEFTVGDDSAPAPTQHGGETGARLLPGTHIKATKLGERALRYATTRLAA